MSNQWSLITFMMAMEEKFAKQDLSPNFALDKPQLDFIAEKIEEFFGVNF